MRQPTAADEHGEVVIVSTRASTTYQFIEFRMVFFTARLLCSKSQAAVVGLKSLQRRDHFYSRVLAVVHRFSPRPKRAGMIHPADLPPPWKNVVECGLGAHLSHEPRHREFAPQRGRHGYHLARQHVEHRLLRPFVRLPVLQQLVLLVRGEHLPVARRVGGSPCAADLVRARERQLPFDTAGLLRHVQPEGLLYVVVQLAKAEVVVRNRHPVERHSVGGDADVEQPALPGFPRPAQGPERHHPLVVREVVRGGLFLSRVGENRQGPGHLRTPLAPQVLVARRRVQVLLAAHTRHQAALRRGEHLSHFLQNPVAPAEARVLVEVGIVPVRRGPDVGLRGRGHSRGRLLVREHRVPPYIRGVIHVHDLHVQPGERVFHHYVRVKVLHRDLGRLRGHTVSQVPTAPQRGVPEQGGALDEAGARRAVGAAVHELRLVPVHERRRLHLQLLRFRAAHLVIEQNSNQFLAAVALLRLRAGRQHAAAHAQRFRFHPAQISELASNPPARVHQFRGSRILQVNQFAGRKVGILTASRSVLANDADTRRGRVARDSPAPEVVGQAPRPALVVAGKVAQHVVALVPVHVAHGAARGLRHLVDARPLRRRKHVRYRARYRNDHVGRFLFLFLLVPLAQRTPVVVFERPLALLFVQEQRALEVPAGAVLVLRLAAVDDAAVVLPAALHPVVEDRVSGVARHLVAVALIQTGRRVDAAGVGMVVDLRATERTHPGGFVEHVLHKHRMVDVRVLGGKHRDRERMDYD
mmetsp:Transcript_27848/g.70381  ORF Transcript_27848/g.70381 Transcript_27848/m.70381 type:complete len:753 (-) Transcript_27848:325-2583(-)